MSSVIEGVVVTRVVIPRSIQEERGQEVLTSIKFVETLKSHGVPVVGSLVIRGVTHGTLYHSIDADSGHIFEWVRPGNTLVADGENLFV